MADLVASVMLVLVVQASILPPSLSSTHWVVTEDGMVTQHLDSVFNLRKPYDLIEFIRQAERSESVHALQTELLNQKIQIDENDDKSDTNIEQQYYDTDGDCMIAEKPLPEYDLYTSTVVPLENKGIDVEEHIDLNAKLPKKLKQPNCSTVLELPFSIHAFEHLKGVQYRKNISDSAEPGLRGAITYKDDTDEFGHLIYKALQRQIVASDDRDPDIECLKRASGQAENDCFNVHHLAEEEVIDVPEATEDIKPQPNPNAEYRDKDWPKKTDCDMNYKGLPVWREYQSTYLPPENKGFHVKPLLTEDLGLVSGPGEEHPLPWYPPVCVHVDDLSGVVTSVDSLNGIANRERIPIKMPDHNVKKILLSLVNDGDVTEEEVGQRILTALKENKESKWILYHLAGLYWRVIGNNYHGVECLRRSIYFAPEEYLDVPLVNLANILLRVGSYKDAATLLKRAVDVNHAEAVSHFTYGNALAAQVNYSGAAHEYITTLDLDSNFELAFKTLHTIKCHEKFHCAAKGSSDDSSGDPSMCQRPPSTSTSSQTERRIVCHHVQGVEQCQMETRQRRISPEEAGCPGICTTTCTSHPPKDMCGGQEPTPCNGCSGNKRCHSCSQTEEGKGFQCHTGPVPPHQCITDALEIIEIDEDDLNQIEDLEESLELLAPVAKALSDEQHTINLKSSDMEGKKMVTVNVKASSTSTKNKKTSSDNATKKKGKENSNNDDLFLIIDSTEYSWPTLEECKNLKKINVQGFTSTWLSVTAKEVDLHEHINFRMNIPDGVLMEPFCEAALGPSLFTLDHLKGLVERDQIDYSAEQGLKEVLQTLSGEHENYEIVGTRIALGLTSNQSSWVLANMAALYWRVEGEGEKSLDCLRQALTFSPRPMKDIALISMANIFHRAGLFEDALVVTGMALEISPDLVVNHFTMANIYAAMGNYIEALKYYETTLLLQEGFQPALERMKTIQCHIQQSSNKK
ncbi:tetratricopeptide repeat protein 17-like [Saccoglossus kowalevskii]